MALQGAIPVHFEAVFPHGVYAMNVVAVESVDERTGRRGQNKDRESGEPVWAVTCIDRDPAARKKEVKVKIASPTVPALPPEIQGTGMHAVEFDHMSVMPYVANGWVAYSYRARSVRAPQNTAGSRASKQAA